MTKSFGSINIFCNSFRFSQWPQKHMTSGPIHRERIIHATLLLTTLSHNLWGESSFLPQNLNYEAIKMGKLFSILSLISTWGGRGWTRRCRICRGRCWSWSRCTRWSGGTWCAPSGTRRGWHRRICDQLPGNINFFCTGNISDMGLRGGNKLNW